MRVSKTGRSLRVVFAASALALATAAPALAVVENVQCNWFGGNCRGQWNHGYTSTTVWSHYLQYDLTHASSSYGTTPDGVQRGNASPCMYPNNWSYSSLDNVTTGRQAYYRNC
jgi:hypothetical protein